MYTHIYIENEKRFRVKAMDKFKLRKMTKSYKVKPSNTL